MTQIDFVNPRLMLWLIAVIVVIAIVVYFKTNFIKIQTMRDGLFHVMHINNNYIRLHQDSIMFKLDSECHGIRISKHEAFNMLQNHIGTLIFAHGHLYLCFTFPDECTQGIWMSQEIGNVLTQTLTYFTPSEREYIIQWIQMIYAN